MLRVELDLYSGRNNPSFVVDDNFAGWLFERAGSLESDSQPNDLGLRGAIISSLTDNSQGFATKDVYISADNQALQRNFDLLSEIIKRIPIDDPDFDEDLVAYLNERLIAPVSPTIVTRSPSDYTPLQVEPLASCTVELARFNPGFWNDPAVIGKNNCYNYATNRRTNTFAQPGRATGSYPYRFACDQVRAAAISDGAKYGATPSGFSACQPDSESPRWFMALVVWPGRDYHWYRCHQERYWGHKPGQTAARNTDNSNRVISNPETCDRGPYTNFCGWFISGKSSKVN